MLEQNGDIRSFPMRSHILQQITLLYGLAFHLQTKSFEWILHFTDLSCSTSAAGIVQRSSLNLSLGLFSLQAHLSSWQTDFLWLSSVWAASLLNASVVSPKEAAISRAE